MSSDHSPTRPQPGFISWLHHHQWGLSIIILTWVAVFFRTLTAQSVYFLDDLKIIFYPLEHVYAAFQADWSLPAWSNYFGFGQPLIAWGQLGFFTPLHLILRLLSLHPLTLLQVSIVSYFAIGLLGFYLFLVRWRLSQTAAALGAVVYVFSGFNIGHLNHVNFYTGTMLLPWLLLTITAFLDHPTLVRTAGLTLVAAAIPLSSQPQISLYTLSIALIYGLVLFLRYSFSPPLPSRLRYIWRVFGLTLLAALLFAGLSSFATLPLQEFLPLTERAAGMSETELFEFNYPPYHAITLLFPYFFGGHSDYWGAKGFQELAAFLGIIPLFLASAALLSWRRQIMLRLISLAWLLVSGLFIFGYLSPLYRYLVVNKILTSFSVPARFLYFSLTAIALLAALGANDLSYWRLQSRRAPRVLASLLLVVLIFVPFFLTMIRDETILSAWQKNVHFLSLEVILLGLGLLMLLGLILIPTRWYGPAWYLPGLAILSSASLVILGWNYNPLTPLSQAFAPTDLQTYLQPTGQPAIPARLYSRPNFYTDRTPDLLIPTDIIGPRFSVLEKLPPHSPACLSIPFYAHAESRGTVTISLLAQPNEPPVNQQTLSTADLRRLPTPTICFPSITEQPESAWYLSFTSPAASGLNLYHHAKPGADSTYFIRLPEPQAADLDRSLKPGIHLAYTPQKNLSVDPEKVLLERHLQVTAPASGARWIGALSVAPYRDFIETFFANDRDDLIDGDGQHVFTTRRLLFDMAGVSHLAQSFPSEAEDLLAQKLALPIIASFTNGNNTVRLYQNPQAYPKAWLVPHAKFNPAADETRALMMTPEFNPRELVYLSGPTPPSAEQLGRDQSLQANVTITQYQPTHLSIETVSDQPAWLVVSDLSTPQWRTLVDGQPSPYYVANTIFKAAFIPAGNHAIQFEYRSPAVETARKLTIISLAITLLLLLIPIAYHHLHFPRLSSSKTND